MTARAEAITNALQNGLVHPGQGDGKPFAIPTQMFRTTGMTDQQADQFIGNAAKLWGEAIDHMLTTAGHPDILSPDLAALQQAAAEAPDSRRVITIYDYRDVQLQSPLFTLTVDKSSTAKTDANALKRALT